MPTKIWIGGGANNNMTTGANWQGGSAPVAGDDLQFGGTNRLAPYNNFAADTSFASITFNAGAGAFTISGNRITMAGTIANYSLNTVQTIALNMIFNATRSFIGGSYTSTTVVSGIISGAGGLTKGGNLKVVLSGLNTYTGQTTITQGELSINTIKNVGGGASSLGAPTTVGNGRISFGGFDNTLIYTGSGDDTDREIYLQGNNTINHAIQQDGSGTLDFLTTPTGTAETKKLILRGTGNGKFTAALADFGGFALTVQKDGTGQWEFTGNPSYTGPTNINAGKFRINGNGILATGLITIAGGAILGGFGNVYAATNFQDNAILSPSMQGVYPAVILQLSTHVALSSASKLEWKLGTVSDRVDITGNLTLDGVIDVIAGPGFAAGTYRIFNYSGSLVNNTLTVGIMPVGYFATVSVSTPTDVDLIVTYGAPTGAPGDKFAFGQMRGQDLGQC